MMTDDDLKRNISKIVSFVGGGQPFNDLEFAKSQLFELISSPYRQLTIACDHGYHVYKITNFPQFTYICKSSSDDGLFFLGNSPQEVLELFCEHTTKSRKGSL